MAPPGKGKWAKGKRYQTQLILALQVERQFGEEDRFLVSDQRQGHTGIVVARRLKG
jgi:hypothetical protein